MRVEFLAKQNLEANIVTAEHIPVDSNIGVRKGPYLQLRLKPVRLDSRGKDYDFGKGYMISKTQIALRKLDTV